MNSMNPVNVLCLKWGTLYSAHYVNNLYRGVAKYLHRPFRFVCITDDPSGLVDGVEAVPILPDPGTKWPWPNIFIKLAVTADGAANLVGPTLFLDIDVAITGDIDCFFDYMPGKNCIIHNWVEKRKTLFRKPPHVGNSSIFRFEAGKSGYIYETFLREMDQAMDTKCYCTEQAFLTYAMKEVHWWPEAWARSFKRHSMWGFPLNLWLEPRLPEGCRILVFHGKPNPDEALSGYRGKRIHHHCLPVRWLEKYWSDK